MYSYVWMCGLCRSAPPLVFPVQIPPEGACAGRRALRGDGPPGSPAEGAAGRLLRSARPAGARRSAHRAALQAGRHARPLRQTLRARRHLRRAGRPRRLGPRGGGGPALKDLLSTTCFQVCKLSGQHRQSNFESIRTERAHIHSIDSFLLGFLLHIYLSFSFVTFFYSKFSISFSFQPSHSYQTYSAILHTNLLPPSLFL